MALDKNTHAAVQFAESSGNPTALNDKTGAFGLYQTMRDTALNPGYGVQGITEDKLTDPDAMAGVGSAYLDAMHDKYGSVDTALAAFNWGPGNVNSWLENGGNFEDLPPETQDYILKVKSQLNEAPVPGGAASVSILDEIDADVPPEQASTSILDEIDADVPPEAEGITTPTSILDEIDADVPPEDDYTVLGEIGTAVAGGVRDFIQSGFLDPANAAGKWMNENVADLRLDADNPGVGGGIARAFGGEADGQLDSGDITMPEVDENKTVVGDVARGMVEFGLAFTSVASAAKKLGVGATTKLGAAGVAAAEGVVAGQWIYDPHAPRLSNLAKQYTENETLRNLLDTVAAEPDDSELVARAKMAFEDAGLGVLTEGVIKGIAKAVGTVARAPMAANIGALTHSPVGPATGFKAQISPNNTYMGSIGTAKPSYYKSLIDEVRNNGWDGVLQRHGDMFKQKVLDDKHSFTLWDRMLDRNPETWNPSKNRDSVARSMYLTKNAGVVVEHALTVGVPMRDGVDGLTHKRYSVSAAGDYTPIAVGSPDWDNGVTLSLADALKPVGEDVEPFLKYMVAKREAELAVRAVSKEAQAVALDAQIAALRAGNGGNHTPASKSLAKQASELRKQAPITNTDPVSVRDRAEVIRAGDATPEFVTASGRLKQYNDGIIDFAEASDVLTPDAAKRIKDASEFYIPFYRESKPGSDYDDAFNDVLSRDHKLIGLKGNEDLGTIRSLDKNLLDNTYKLIHHSVLNNAKAKFFKDMQAAPQDVLDAFGVKPASAIATSPNVVSVRIGGELKKFTVEDEMLLESFQSLYDAGLDMNSFMKILSGSKRLLTAGATASPTFGIRNFIRDAVTSFFMAEGKQRNMLPFISQLKAIKTMHDPATDRLVQEAYLNGAGFSSIRQAEVTHADFKQNLHRFYEGKGISSTKVIMKPVEWYKTLLNKVENSSRVAQYDSMIKQGATKEEAAFAARNVSTDFSRRGSSKSMQLVNAVTPFFNAALQGNYTTYRKVFDSRDTAKMVKRVAGIGMGLVAASMTLEYNNANVPVARNQPDWVKATHWIFPVDADGMPTWDADGAVDVMLLPKPYDLGVYAQLGETIMRAIGRGPDGVSYEGSDGMQLVQSTGGYLWNTFLLGPSVPLANTYSMMTAEDPKKFTGQSVIPKSMQGIDSRLQYTDKTPELYRAVGQATNTSPMRLEAVVASIVGTLATEIVGAADPAVRAMTDRPQTEAKGLHDMPVFRALFREGSNPPRQVERFYNLVSATAKADKTLTFAVNQGLVTDLQVILESDKDFAALAGSNKELAKASQELSQINKELNLILRAPDNQYSSEVKKHAVEGARIEMYKSVVKIHDELNKVPEFRKKMNSSGIAVMGQ